MGIRVNKVIGWGLTDVQVGEHYSIVDERFNAVHDRGVLSDEAWQEPYRWTINGFLDFFDEWDGPDSGFDARLARTMLEARAKRDGSLRTDSPFEFMRLFTLQPEYGLPVLCVTPTTSPDWHRTDDTLDWLEETYLKGDSSVNGEAWVRELPDAPFPYNSFYMNAHTGERVKNQESILLRRLLTELGDKVIGDGEERVLGSLAQDCGFDSLADAAENMVPMIPAEIRAMCAYAELFTDPATVDTLRPIFYCYWA